MLLLERQREAVDDAAEDLEELGDAVVALGLVDEAVKCVVDLLADVGAEAEELAVDAVQDGLEEVALARVLAVEEVEQLHEELLVDGLLGGVGLEVGRLEESEEELVDDLEVGPRRLQVRLVLLRVEFRACGRKRRVVRLVSCSVRNRDVVFTLKG